MSIRSLDPAWLKLIDDAAEAEEMFGVDECERFADEQRTKARQSNRADNNTGHVSS